MDIIKILQKQEFKDFYCMSKSVFKGDSTFPYNSAISANVTKDKLHSVKFYFGTYQKMNDLSELEKFFSINDILHLYKIWDIDNIDNKGLSFCIKYYPNSNSFKYQIHCKVTTPLTFKNLSFSDKDCRYGVGIETGKTKNYINIKNNNDKVLVSKHFNIPELVFFDELEYCEFDNYSKVVTSYNNQKTYLLRNYLLKKFAAKKEEYPMIASAIDQLHVGYNYDLRNFGFYKDLDLYSLYFYLPGKENTVDSYEPFAN